MNVKIPNTTRCEKCIHNKICVQQVNIQTDTYAYMNVKYDTEKCRYYIAADVVPRETVEQIFEEIEGCIYQKWGDSPYSIERHIDYDEFTELKKKYIGEQK